MKIFVTASVVLFCLAVTSPAADKVSPKKAFGLQDAMKFKSIRKPTISEDGRFIAFATAADRGDGEAIVQSTVDSTKYIVSRGDSPVISKNSLWVAMSLLPNAIDAENTEGDKDKPKNGMALLNTNNGEIVRFDKVGKFEFSNDSKWLAYTAADDDDKGGSGGKDQPKAKDKPITSTLYLRHLQSGTEIRIQPVADFTFDSLSAYFFYSICDKDGKRNGLYYRRLDAEFAPEYKIKAEDNLYVSNLTWNNTGQMLAFLSTHLNSDGAPQGCGLMIWHPKIKATETVLDTTEMPKRWYLPHKNQLKWTRDGKRLFFGLKPLDEKKDPEKKELKYNDSNFFDIPTILKKTQLYVWHTDDPRISTNQRNWWDKNSNRTFYAIYHLDKKSIVQLADDSLPDVKFANNPYFAIGYSELPYQKESTWLGSRFDLYAVDLVTGQRKLVAPKLAEPAYISPSGKYIAYFKDKHWHLYNCHNDSTMNLTASVDYPFYDDDFDQPDDPPSYGFAGWLEDDEGAIIYDKYDIWTFFSDGGMLGQTAVYGRTTEMKLRIVNLDPDKELFHLKDSVLLTGFYIKEKQTGFFIMEFKILGISKVLEEKKTFRVIAKAKNADAILFSLESYDEFPDLWVSDISFATPKKLTDVNPQIKDYRWGSSELVEWKSPRGDTLQGVLLKPDGFDPKRRYPVLIYFYERFSDYAYHFSQPRVNHRPCYQVYLSDGYVIFLPDIKYKTGSPGPSALEALLSGARMLGSEGVADTNAVGIQGHSWGGYEAAYIITQTDFFKAASAGAPVGNMTSAYSGIRLESGLARQFQYERSQSRIGADLWDSLDCYLNNSPVIKAPNVHTPLLIEVGDKDEAVPWQQSIELYLALRRLGKFCVMLQYTDESHHPRKYQNKLDYAIKMKEYFDHYLLGKPAPEWLLKGKIYKGD